MSFKHVNFKPSINSFLFLALFVMVFYGFSNPTTTQEKEYMTITLENHINHHLYFISTKEDDVTLKALVNPRSNFLQKRLKFQGFDVKIQDIKSTYDYSYLFELIENYEKDGWSVVSHSLGSTDFEEVVNTTVNQYLMSRTKE